MSDTELPIHAHPQSKDTDESVRDNTAPVQIMRIWLSEKGALILGIILVAILAAYALARAEAAADQARIAERESRVLQERVSDMKVELIRRGIPVSDH